MSRKYFFLIFLFVLRSLPVFSQTLVAYINAGDKAMKQGDYYSASLYYYQAIEFESEDPQLYYKAAEACRLYNDYENAIRFYNLAISNDKENQFPLAVFWLATMKKFTGDYEQSKLYFNKYFNLHYQDSSSYYVQRAKMESSNCDSAVAIMKDTVPAKVENLGSTINSVFSDFAGQQTSDSTLYYSSLRFITKASEKKKTKNFVSKILQSRSKNATWMQPDLLDSTINNENYFVGNSSLSPNHKLMIFTNCIQSGPNLICELFESLFEKGEWSTARRLDDTINIKGFTSTQPCLAANGAEGYVLYFVSDRPGGYGKLDIWKSSRSMDGKYSPPVNLGARINTAEDDLTPYFNSLTQTLYFSSDGHPGLGGYDVFQSELKNNEYQYSGNIGYPLNTSYNEIYFSVNSNDKTGLLSSNRPGSMFIKARTCCYDIYDFRLLEPVKPVIKTEVPVDSATIANQIKLQKDSINLVAAKTYVTFLPLKLYFHNDQPDPKTTKTSTQKNYEELYSEYLKIIPEYSKNYSANEPLKEKVVSDSLIQDFFTKTVIAAHNDLERFCQVLLNQLKEDKRIEITVRGSASPLAKSDYNTRLSKRRISSLINYITIYANGALSGYLKERKLTVREDPVGETLASKNVSDNLKDKRNSVYSPAASALRYIEIINVSVDGQEAK